MEPPSPPSFPPKESLINRCKPIWRSFLIFNLALGAYMFAGARKKDAVIANSKSAEKKFDDHKATKEDPSEPITSPATPIAEMPYLPYSVLEPLKVLEPIPEDQQLELFQWILEEKRKAKPKSRQEKQRNDEDKAILKQYIRAKSIPSL
ncbi:uncharacterized protein LOC121250904 isoform X2 [Juglans microcarpa x Juglans regia]|uniref:uncharacterized protein LOC121250904 isoform X2 n=1 Tax=Juglans microcarpa x Juglans regia TaxID=2249226 RepID=UPI001B7ECEBE|nr:uncharacterized protein LOC121250904 isoform X2 [Juglans microcarpa x Juglans regia]